MDYEAWALDLCTLLDRIELANDDPEVEALVKQRFEIAEKHGVEIVWSGVKTSGEYN